SVESGRAALERLAQHAYDLIVCDLHMTDRDGPAVYRAIERRAPPRPAFLFVTGYAEAGPDAEIGGRAPPGPASWSARGSPEAGPYEEFLRTVRVPVVGKPFDINVLRET